jgi:hypothetical protein
MHGPMNFQSVSHLINPVHSSVLNTEAVLVFEVLVPVPNNIALHPRRQQFS